MEGYSPRWRSPGPGDNSPRFRGRNSYRGDSARYPYHSSPRYRHNFDGSPYRSPYGSPYNYRGFDQRGPRGFGYDQGFRHWSPGFSPAGRQRGRGGGRQSFGENGIDCWISPEMWEDPWEPFRSKSKCLKPNIEPEELSIAAVEHDVKKESSMVQIHSDEGANQQVDASTEDGVSDAGGAVAELAEECTDESEGTPAKTD